MTLSSHALSPHALSSHALSSQRTNQVQPDRPVDPRIDLAVDALSRRTILLVEDEPFVRQATRGILERAGFEVLPAIDVPEAMILYEARKPHIDLVLTDMVLRGGTGRQLAHDLRLRSQEIVILITSGYGNPEFTIEAPESRIYFLAKPYSRRTLLDKIEQILALPLRARPANQAG